MPLEIHSWFLKGTGEGGRGEREGGGGERGRKGSQEEVRIGGGVAEGRGSILVREDVEG